MAFNVAAESYDKFMGRYSSRLSPQLADLARIGTGMKVVDVGCGPGALTAELVKRVGSANVAAIDPSEEFVAATRERFPGVNVQHAFAESLPFEDRMFGSAVSQLVVHFMKDPVGGIREMARVTRKDGTVAACVWDHGGRRTPISTFWDAAEAFDPGLNDESDLPGTRAGQLVQLFRAAGLREVEGSELSVSATLGSFAEWWEAFLLGVGPAGTYAKNAAPERLAAIRDRARQLLGDGPVNITGVAWAARGTV